MTSKPGIIKVQEIIEDYHSSSKELALRRSGADFDILRKRAIHLRSKHSASRFAALIAQSVWRLLYYVTHN